MVGLNIYNPSHFLRIEKVFEFSPIGSLIQHPIVIQKQSFRWTSRNIIENVLELYIAIMVIVINGWFLHKGF